MSKQRGLDLGAHILPATPAGPVETQHTDNHTGINVVGAKENTKSPGRDEGLLR